MIPTVADILAEQAQKSPERTAFRFLRQAGTEESLSFSELNERVEFLAQYLVKRAATNDRAALMFPPGLDFIVAFLACQRAGLIPVPLALPRTREPNDRIAALLGHCVPRFILSDNETEPALEKRGLGIPVIALDQHKSSSMTSMPPSRRTNFAFLQYTSGSTGTPKGVMVSHDNILTNMRDITVSFGVSPETRNVSWLPAYHDMGLVGSILAPIFAGCLSILMAPAAFLKNPLIWLKAISDWKADVSGGPNFGYELCARRLMDKSAIIPLAELDLSSWRIAFVGAEPVRSAMLTRFTAAAAPYDFRSDAFFPCYGMAESTLYVSGANGSPRRLIRSFDGAKLGRGKIAPPAEQSGAGQSRCVDLVACGDIQASSATTIAIVDPEQRVSLPQDSVGEIWINGPSIAAGYWDRPADTKAKFANTLPDRKGKFLRTGDVGFIHDGRLFVTGRLDDLIVLNGENYHPEDIEHTISSHIPELSHTRTAVFAVQADSVVRVVAAQELPRQGRLLLDRERIGKEIRRIVWDTHGLAIADVALIPPGSLPVTSSGKVQRRLCRDLFLTGKMPSDVASGVADRPAVPESEIKNANQKNLGALVSIVAEALSLDPNSIPPDRPISTFGFDSLKTIEVQLMIESRLGWTLSGDVLHSDMTFADLAARGMNSGPPRAFYLDATLSADIRPIRSDSQPTNGDTLVTGAAGLLGARLVRELLRTTHATIHCLVRPKNGTSASDRLFDSLSRQGVSRAEAGARVKVVGGDASAARFGLEPAAFKELSTNVGRIFHSSAVLDFVRPYLALREGNVGATHQIIAFAAQGRPKNIVHISSVSVLEAAQRGTNRVDESLSLDDPERLAVGYAQSKWVADTLVTQARERGFPAMIIRPSWIVAEAHDVDAADFLVRFLQGCCRLGALPNSPYRWDLVPADYVARAIVRLALEPNNNSGTYHIGCARPVSIRSMADFFHAEGLPLRIISMEAWRERLRDALMADHDNPLRPLAPLFLDPNDGKSIADSYLSGQVPIMDSRRTRARLRHIGIEDIRIDRDLIKPLIQAVTSTAAWPTTLSSE